MEWISRRQRHHNSHVIRDFVSIDITKNIGLGKPAAADLIFGHDLGVMEGGQYEACATAPGAISYDWSVAGANIVSGQGSGCIIFEVYCNDSLHMWVNGVNACGEGAGDEAVRDIECDDGGGGGGMLSITPNPSDDMVTVTVDEDYSLSGEPSQTYVQTSQDHPYQYNLYDLNYQLIREFTTDMQSVQISTNDLEDGFYILHVVQGEKVYRAKIEVRH
ncbi:MAG: T9SS type A sorting domain-containing protein [Bacteroidales bacterium]|nr:T9SS type A sorting domain-containing protein [Bacteroidales bacterium]